MSRRVQTPGAARGLSTLSALFVIGAVCQYLGASIAVPLFGRFDPATVAWLRAAGAGVVLLAVWWPLAARRWPRIGVRFPPRRLLTAAAFGLVTLGMNMAFYTAIDSIDLGVAVAIEFLGPVVVAAAGSRTLSDGFAVLAVLVGVVLLSGASVEGSPEGVLFALLAAALWAAYIVVGKVVAGGSVRRGTEETTSASPAAGRNAAPWRDGIDDLAIGLTVAGALAAPLVIGLGGSAGTDSLWSWRIVAIGIGLGVLSSAIPYLLDQIVLSKVGRSQFALLLALLPVTAAVVGALALAQIPTVPELCGMALVIAAIVFTARTTDIASGAGTG
ncbi:EamA family transporter [Williamsia sp. 1138]|uniref:EamA family transporter n=1 Tax=Gordonia rubripertincta TaxID=36822 RepID=A0ABT4MU31_GORRU|nr:MULTISPECIES: EamA family transporter [Mycobacteriales]MCZ4550472.1 EamA family transporter [Gordonia rubripertincta]OZG26672.1 EamA family transporter [Williamsia sp. 1138]